MARIVGQYQPRGTGRQNPGLPTVATVVPRMDTVQEDSATRLARALGVLNPGQIAQSIGQIQAADEQKDKQDATAWANSMTVDELGKKIRSGEVMPSQSPVFQATVQHLYGDNYRNTLERDTLSKLSSGELKFNSPEELDGYLTQQRNDFLKGQSRFTVAGFDRGWNNFRDRATGAVLQMNDKQAQDRGVQEASDSLSNTLLAVTNPNFTGTVDDQVNTLMKRYDLLTSTHLLRDDSRKAALGNLMVTIAGSGRQDLLKAMLNKQLPNNGPTIGAVLGDRMALSLSNTAEATYDRAQRQRVDTELAPFLRDADNGNLNLENLEKWRQANEKYVTSGTVEHLIRSNEAAQIRLDKQNALQGIIMQRQEIISNAQQQARALVSSRQGYQMPDVTIPTDSGGTKVIKGKDFAAQAVAEILQANPDMPFDEQVRLHANNSVENPQWKAALNAASVNIGEVGVDAQGKPIGKLLPQTLEALDQFRIINQVSTGYAREMAGGERNYQILSNIEALRESGVSDPNIAASLVNQAERNTAKNSESITNKVNASISKITNPSIFSGRFWSQVATGEWGSGEKNLRVIQGAVGSLAKAYMAANVSATGDEAVRKAVEYYSNPSVSTQVNNTIYFNKDLPQVPKGGTQSTWFKRFMDTKVADDLKARNINYSADDIVLQPMLGGEPRYMLHLNGTPIGIEYRKSDVEAWIANQDKQDIDDRIRQKQVQKNPNAFLSDQTPGGAALVFRNPRP